MKKLMKYEDSLTLLSSLTFKEKTKEKTFLINSLGKVLAEDIIADHNSPEFPTSGMDGYSIKYEDQENEFIEILGDLPAGLEAQIEVSSNKCIKTFTGSLMPKGADTLIPVENVEVIDNKIKIIEKVKKGFAVREVGENYRENEVLIKKGTIIGFAEIGVMSSLNLSQVSVFSKPIVAIASTGSEILDVGDKQTNSSQIRSSNHLTVEALAKNAGAETLQLGIIKDDIDEITEVMKSALSTADIVVTTGGVSKGDYDFVQDVVKKRLDAEVLFHGVNLKPGKPLLVARKEDKLIISLPGFAYSSTVCAILYLLPMIYKRLGSNKKLPIVKAKIEQDYPLKMKKTIFSACNVRYEDNEYKINFEGKKSGTSAILTNMLGSPAILIQKEDSQDLKAGDLADIILLNELN